MVAIHYLPEFLKQAKHLTRKYASFPEDLKTCIQEITDNPLAGADLGGGVRKVRMAIKSKGKGKSGGARVITFNYALDEGGRDVTLMTVYDKSERSTISDQEITALRVKVEEE